jgi:hypothetical protein
MTFLLITMLVIAYIFIGMVVGSVFYKIENLDDWLDSPTPLFGGALWPLTAVFVVLYFMGRLIIPMPLKAAQVVAGWFV